MFHVLCPATRARAIAAVLLLVTALLAYGLVIAPPAAAAVAGKIAPASAPVGTGITVAGAGLAKTSRVVFLGAAGPEDDVDAAHFVALDDKKLVVQIPPGAQTGPVEVTTPDGPTPTPGPVTVLQAPSIDAVSASWGKPDDVITITGTDLFGVKPPAVMFGVKKATLLAGSSATELNVKVPAGLVGGPTTMSVTTPGGTVRRDFVIAAAVKAMTPATGTTAGGTVASIVGAGFTGVDNFSDDPATPGVNERFSGVTIGGTPVRDLIAVSDKEIIVKVPPGTDVAAPVVVRTRHDDTLTESGDLVKYAYRPLPAVTGVSKNFNAVNDPSEVVFTGVNLTEATIVRVGGVAPASVVADAEAGTLTVTPPLSLKAAVTSVTFTNVANNVGFTTAVPFAYITAPVVSKLTPATGPEGTVVAIAGTGFDSSTTVAFGDTPASCTVVSFILVRCTAPAGADVVDVTATNGVGANIPLLAGKFTYVEGTATPPPVTGLPAVAPLIPSYGANGSTVDLRGANVGTATKIEFTGAEDTWVEAAGMLTVGPGRVVVTVPAGAVTGELRITSPAGEVETVGRVFTKTVRPSISSIDVVGDTTFAATPGDLVTIKGAGLIIKGVKTAVTVGGKAVPILTKPAPNARTIVVRVPAMLGGREAVVVRTPLGEATAPVKLFFVPEVKTVKPVTYSRTGGAVATIAGIGFTGVDDVTIGEGRLSAVTFGGVAVTKLVLMSDKMLVAVTARGSATADHLVVTTQHEGRFGTSDGTTRSVDAPIARIDTVSPDTGPTGATPPAVTLTGAHLYASSSVRFGASTATVQSAALDGSSMVVIPPTRAAPATVSITVVNTDDGDELTSTKVGAYTYVLQPAVITGMSASTAEPGTTVTISGSSMVNVSSVTFGAVPAQYTVVNASTIFATVPATPSGAAGTTVDVTVVNGTGQPSTADPATANDWTWDNTPFVTSLSTNTGPMGSTVTISGSNFAGVTRVRFGYTDATTYTLVDANTITAVVPATPAGAGGQIVDLVVEVNGVASKTVNAPVDDWTWFAPAVVTAMSHNTAPAGTTVTVTGRGFSHVSSVAIHTKPVSSYTVISDTSMTFVVPASDASGPMSAGSKRDMRIVNGSGLVSTADPAAADDWTFQ